MSFSCRNYGLPYCSYMAMLCMDVWILFLKFCFPFCCCSFVHFKVAPFQFIDLECAFITFKIVIYLLQVITNKNTFSTYRNSCPFSACVINRLANNLEIKLLRDKPFNLSYSNRNSITWEIRTLITLQEHYLNRFILILSLFSYYRFWVYSKKKKHLDSLFYKVTQLFFALCQ